MNGTPTCLAQNILKGRLLASSMSCVKASKGASANQLAHVREAYLATQALYR